MNPTSIFVCGQDSKQLVVSGACLRFGHIMFFSDLFCFCLLVCLLYFIYYYCYDLLRTNFSFMLFGFVVTRNNNVIVPICDFFRES